MKTKNKPLPQRNFWKLPLLWFLLFFIGVPTLVFLTQDLLPGKYIIDDTADKIGLAIGALITLILTYVFEWRASKKKPSTDATDIEPEAAPQPAKSRKMPAGLIAAIAIYALLAVVWASTWADEIEDSAGFIALFASLSGIIGTLFINKKAGHLLVVLPVIISILTGFVFRLDAGGDIMVFLMAAAFYTVPYFFVRYFLCKNGRERLFGTTGKIIFYALCALLLATLSLLLSNKSYKDLGPYSYGMRSMLSYEGKWGYLDSYDEVREAIPCLYDKAGTFQYFGDGKWTDDRDRTGATVCLNGKWGVIDRYGNEIIPLEYDQIYTTNSMWSVRLNDKWGVIDSTKTIIIPIEYDEIKYANPNKISVILDGEVLYFNAKGEKIEPEPVQPVQPALPQSGINFGKLKIADFDQVANKFSFVDTETGKKLSYSRILLDGQPVVTTECILKDGTEMLKFVLKEKQLLGTRQEGGQTVSTYSGESYTAFSIYAELRYRLDDNVLIIMK
jgi:hypothetical protein